MSLSLLRGSHTSFLARDLCGHGHSLDLAFLTQAFSSLFPQFGSFALWRGFKNHPVLVPSNSSFFDASLPPSSHHRQRAETTKCLPRSAHRSPWLLNHAGCLQVLLHTSLQEAICQPLCPHITRTPFSSFREYTPPLPLSYHLHVLKIQILPRACPTHPWLSPRCFSRSFYPMSTAQFQKYSHNSSSSLPGASLCMHDNPHKLPALK